MARVTQEHIDARRRQILLAAMRMFGRKGLEPGAATIEDIAQEAGLSKGAIYGYYKNKDDLLAAIRDASVEMDRVLFADVPSESETSWDAFWAVARRVWDTMLDDDGREIQMLSLERRLLEIRSGDDHEGEVDEPPAVVIGALAKLLSGAQDEGRLAADLDAQVLAATLWACQQGIRGYYLRTGDTTMSNAVLEILEDLLTRTVSGEGA